MIRYSLNLMEYRQCLRCVMDTSYIDIKFDKNGICNFMTF